MGCDVIRAESGEADAVPRHFVGYGGAAIFGRIPHFTENRLTKYYKGVLSQLFGDLGPFFVGASLASLEKIGRGVFRRPREWAIAVDGEERARGRYQALIIVNGDLGPDLPFARSVPLGSGDFYLFGLRDLGLRQLPGQFQRCFDGTILGRDPRPQPLEPGPLPRERGWLHAPLPRRRAVPDRRPDPADLAGLAGLAGAQRPRARTPRPGTPT